MTYGKCCTVRISPVAKSDQVRFVSYVLYCVVCVITSINCFCLYLVFSKSINYSSFNYYVLPRNYFVIVYVYVFISGFLYAIMKLIKCLIILFFLVVIILFIYVYMYLSFFIAHLPQQCHNS